MRAANTMRSGFSLIRLVIVVVIIGIIGASPSRVLSRGSAEQPTTPSAATSPCSAMP